MSKNFEQLFFFSDFFGFFIKKVYFSKTIQYFFLVLSLPPRRVLKTFSEKNLKKKKRFVQKFRTTFCENASPRSEVRSRVATRFFSSPLSTIHSLPRLGRCFDPEWPQIFSSPTTKNVLLPPLGRWFDPRRQQHFSPSQKRWDNRDKNYGVTRDRTIDQTLQLTTSLPSSHKGKSMKMFIYCLGFRG